MTPCQLLMRTAMALVFALPIRVAAEDQSHTTQSDCGGNGPRSDSASHEQQQATDLLKDPGFMQLLQFNPGMALHALSDGTDIVALRQKQAQWAEQVRTLSMPPNPTEHQVLDYLEALRKHAAAYPQSNFDFFQSPEAAPLTRAVANVPQEFLPLLLRRPPVIPPHVLVEGLRQMNVAPYKDEILEAAKQMPDLYRIVFDKGWQLEALPVLLDQFGTLRQSDIMEQTLTLLAENWKPEYLEKLKYGLFNSYDRTMVLKAVRKIGSIDQQVHDDLVTSLWLQRDPLGMQERDLMELNLLAFFAGQVDAAFPLLAKIVNHPPGETYSDFFGDLSPTAAERAVQSALGQSLSAAQLIDWLREHRATLEFDPTSRRYRIATPD